MSEQDDVMVFLGPWLERLFAPFHKAMSLYNDEYPATVRAEHTDSVAAHNVHCHIVSEYEREFGLEPQFNFMTVRNLQVLNIEDRIVGRWKKVDKEGLHRNHTSKQQRAFDAQEQLPGLPPDALHVTFGYEPDAAFSTCQRVMVARPQGKKIIWAAQIIEADNRYTWEDITPHPLPGMEPRTKGIRFSKK